MSEFCAAKVDFLLVGAYALATRGLVRATGDIDLWVRPTPENAQRVVHALARFGAPMDQVDVSDFYSPSLIFQVGLAPRRIDIITVIDGVDFEEAWQSREAILVDGIEIFTLSRAHLLKNKLASARDKDLSDARWLETTG